MNAAYTWLENSALKTWTGIGFDEKTGGFQEAISLDGKVVTDLPRRGLVQARQIYSCRVALDLKVGDAKVLRSRVASAIGYFMKNYSVESGALKHSITTDGKTVNGALELYTQAFGLFGLASAYAVLQDPELKTQAKRLLQYLLKERHLKNGGFSEVSKGETVYVSNPHMHLFEAALAWIELDADPIWKNLALEVVELCETKFIDAKTGLLAEYFTADWQPLMSDNRFVAEPGHQFEWSWLMSRADRLCGTSTSKVRERLFRTAEKYGICPELHVAYGEIWSDYTPKMKMSRLWTQCERIKCAVAMGPEGESAKREGMRALMRYFDLPQAGLWYDRLEENGKFIDEPAKASSLYHIIGAISEHGPGDF